MTKSQMSITFAVVGALLMVVALASQIRGLRLQNADLRRQISALSLERSQPATQEPSPAPPPAPAQITETQSPTNTASPPAPQPPTGSISAHIDQLRSQIADLQARILTLQGDKKGVDRNATTYQRDQQLSGGAQNLNLQQQIQDLDAQVLDRQSKLQILAQTEMDAAERDRQRLALEADVGTLRTQRAQLQSQIQTNNEAAKNQTVAAQQEAAREHTEMTQEEQNLRQQLASRQSDLKYWLDQQAKAGRQ